MKAKPLSVEKWLNTDPDFDLQLNDGRIKFIHVFQMLCPGCVYYGIPQTVEIFKKYQSPNFQVAALHSVFEHHEVMTEEALKVFIDEWRLPFPVGIDKRIDDHWMPETMKSFHLQGTPSTIVIDGQGELRLCHFGHFEMDRLERFLDELSNQAERGAI